MTCVWNCALWWLLSWSYFHPWCCARVESHRVSILHSDLESVEDNENATTGTAFELHSTCFGGRSEYLCPVLRGGQKDKVVGDILLELRLSRTGEKGDYLAGPPPYSISLRKLALVIAKAAAGASAYEATKFSAGDGLMAPGAGFCMFAHQFLLGTRFAAFLKGTSRQLFWGAEFPNLEDIVTKYVGASVGDVLSWLEPFICFNLDSVVQPGSLCIVVSPGFGLSGMLIPTNLKVGIEKRHILYCYKASNASNVEATLAGKVSKELFQEPADIRDLGLQFAENGDRWSSDKVKASLNYMRASVISLAYVNNVPNCPMRDHMRNAGSDYQCQKCAQKGMALKNCSREHWIPSESALVGIEYNCNICPTVVKKLVNAYHRLSAKIVTNEADQVWLGEPRSIEMRKLLDPSAGYCTQYSTNCSQDADSHMCPYKRLQRVGDVGECSDLCQGYSGDALAKCKDIAHRLVGRSRLQVQSAVLWTPRRKDKCFQVHELRPGEFNFRDCQLFKVVYYRFLRLKFDRDADTAATEVCAELGSLRRGWNTLFYPCFLREGEKV